jgi:hypothetical protein
MLADYKRKSNYGAAIFLLSIISVSLMASGTGGKNIWENANWLPTITYCISVVAFFFSVWALAKAKGYSGIVGLILPFLSIFGLLILLFLKDKHPGPS